MAVIDDLALERPVRLDDALRLLAEQGGGAMALAGGTDLVPNLRRGLHAPRRLVDLGAIPGFAAIARDGDAWRLGAGVTLASVAASESIAAAFPALAQAARGVAGPAHRSAATLGGNLCQDTRCVHYNQSAWWRAANHGCLKLAGDICHVAPQGSRCHAAYEGDLAPALVVYGAELEIASARGARRVTVGELYRDDGAAHLALDAGELVVAVHLRTPPRGTASGYRKVRARAAIDFPLAGVAVALRRRGDALDALAIAVTGTNSRPFALAGCETLVGRTIDDALLHEISTQVQRQVTPMRSTVTASNYRRHVAAVTARRLVAQLAGGTGGTAGDA